MLQDTQLFYLGKKVKMQEKSWYNEIKVIFKNQIGWKWAERMHKGYGNCVHANIFGLNP